ncbi:MAG: hypothetical protein LBF15_02635 [Candidatus Peribacteria bacterium]|nr:hypothetical protein [Candidatus Peribacteria bacterium]
MVGDNAPEKLLSGASWLLYFALGFIAFITLLVIFGIFGLYNFFVFALIFVVFVALSYKEIGEIFTKTLA